MRRTLIVLAGAALLGLAFASEAVPARGQEPIESRTVLEALVDRLPEGPACWDIRRGSLAPGAKSPATGFYSHGMAMIYVTAGAEQLTYDPAARAAPVTVAAGQAVLIADKMPHAHQSVGDAPRANINFELNCERLAGSLGNRGPLPGHPPRARRVPAPAAGAPLAARIADAGPHLVRPDHHIRA